VAQKIRGYRISLRRPGLFDLLKFVKEKKELQESMKHTSLGMFD
jgi:hypothetical protein